MTKQVGRCSVEILARYLLSWLRFFVIFPVLPGKCQIVPQLDHDFFPIHSPVVLAFNTIQSQILTAS
jgi:hypothetical protein